MKIRGARKSDSKFIDEIYKEYDFTLDPKHLEMIMIAEDDNGNPIAIMSLNTLLECCFLTVKSSNRKDKIESLKELVKCGKIAVKNLGYDLVHAFSNDTIAPILAKHFKFVDGKGKNQVLFVD